MRILVLDCHKNMIHESEKIVRALQRTEGVEVEIAEVRKLQFPTEEYDAYVISGADGFSQRHIWIRKLKEFIKGVIDSGKPVLGVCYGNHLLASIYNHEMVTREPEVGWHNIELTEQGMNGPLFAGFPQSFPVFEHHTRFDDVTEGVLARNKNGVQAVRYAENVWGMHFHAEETPQSGVWFLMDDKKCKNLAAAIKLKPENYIEWRVYENFVKQYCGSEETEIVTKVLSKEEPSIEF
jgi:GMP synthase-like glutamine amidotransferase